MPELRVTIPTGESAPEKIDYFTTLEHSRAAYGRIFLQSLTAHTHRERARSHFGTRWPGEPLVTASTGALVATTNPHTLMRPSYTPQGKDNKKSHRGFFFPSFLSWGSTTKSVIDDDDDDLRNRIRTTGWPPAMAAEYTPDSRGPGGRKFHNFDRHTQTDDDRPAKQEGNLPNM